MDVLDIMLAEIERHEKASTVALLKTADGYMTLTRKGLEPHASKLKELETRTLTTDEGDVEVPVYDLAVDGEEAKTLLAELTKSGSDGGIGTDPTSGGEGGGVPSTIKTSTLTIGGVDYAYSTEPDSLGRETHVFALGEIDHAVTPIGFVYRGGVARLHVPKDTPQEEIRSMLSAISQRKNAKTRKDASDTDFLEALEDAMESLSVNAISGAYYAFCSVVMDMWNGELAELDETMYDAYVDQFATALKQIWRKYGDVSDIVQLAMQTQALLRKGMTAKSEKAGATLSRARRDQLESAIEIINGVLGTNVSTDDDDSKDKNAGSQRTKGAAPATFDADFLLSELNRVKEEFGSEVRGLKDAQTQLESQNTDLKTKLAEKDALLDRVGKVPLPDPLAEGSPTNEPTVTSGGSIYDIASS